MSLKQKLAQWVQRRVRLPVAGLDISDRSVKYARFAVLPRRVFGGTPHLPRVALVDYGEEEIPEGVVVRGVVEREDALVSALVTVATHAGHPFRSSGMVVSLPEEKSFLKMLQTPRVADSAMPGAVRWAMEGQIPVVPDEVIYDYKEIHPPSADIDHRDVVVTAFPKGIVVPYIRAIRAAGLTPVALELESQAIIRAVVRDMTAPDAQIILDMGRTRTSFIIVASGAIVFTSTIGIGGQVLEKDIAIGLGVSKEEAMRIKKEIGLSKTSHEGKLYTALMPSLIAITDELNRTIAYYNNHVTHAHGASDSIQRIILSGGDAGLYGLDTYLAVATRVSVILADPFTVLYERGEGGIPAMPHHQALAYAAAMGLALRGIRQDG